MLLLLYLRNIITIPIVLSIVIAAVIIVLITVNMTLEHPEPRLPPSFVSILSIRFKKAEPFGYRIMN